ncbi:ubiquitin carboxyl-terminal hydrolase MINDY-1 [Denticeps clupeoides]|uniref:Ubiquitin carboxyl-terminal hydrolase n=1 Tax=Denticeps clupeoides TaxID=299321 RepID=A0AAY4CMX8_9TELE|nr:ubiquitin carboxyl-terminal hydrolase MINDY-1 [Denticeps clupeoides]
MADVGTEPANSGEDEVLADLKSDYANQRGPNVARPEDASLGDVPSIAASAQSGEGSGSDDQSLSGDTASFLIPSLDLSGSHNGLSSPSTVGAEGQALLGGEPCADAAVSGAGAAEATLSSTMPQDYYFVKWITWKEKKTPIITQSENGPCPLLAIMNVLFLRWKALLPPESEVITREDLMSHLGECVLSVTPRQTAEGMELNFQQNMNDAMAVLPKLSTGLDVNVRFTAVSDFEYTPECIVFDLLDIPLYHGWLVDPQSPEVVSAVGKLSYNQLVEKIIDYKHSSNCTTVNEGLIAEQFLESTATQLTYHGLCELNTTAKDGELSVFFRNNHFSTMIKHKGNLYLLVTDQGFLQEEGVVWESLHNVEGDGNFCDSEFRLSHLSQRSGVSPSPAVATPQQQQQIDQDYLVAMSLQQHQEGMAPEPMSDLELARQLQQEEYQQPQTSNASMQQVRGQASGQQSSQRRRDKKDESDCVVL